MPLRLGPGPVFVYEWLTTSRRWQPYAMRAVFVWLVLIGMAIVEGDRPTQARRPLVSPHDAAVIGEQIYRTVALIELTLVLLVAPAVTAGAVCLDKARGTLDHMLVTDLSNAEIVLGKLGARLIPVLGLIACTVPVLALASLLGGIDPMALVGLFLVAIGCAVRGRLAGDGPVDLRAEDPRSRDDGLHAHRPVGHGAGPAGNRAHRADGEESASAPAGCGESSPAGAVAPVGDPGGVAFLVASLLPGHGAL